MRENWTKRLEILRYLAAQAAWSEGTPSVREVGDAVGLRSSQTAYKHLKKLEEAGYVERTDNAIELRNPNTGALLRQLSASPQNWWDRWRGDAPDISGLSISPDGSLLLSAHYGLVMIWDLSRGELLRTVDALPGGEHIAVSSDGRYFIVQSVLDDHGCTVYALSDGHLLTNIDGGSSLDNTLVISPDGGWFATGGSREIQLWQLPTGEKLAALVTDKKTRKKVDKDHFDSVAISPDGRFLFGGTSGRGHIVVWDLHTKEVLDVLAGHENSVTCLAVSPDGRFLFSGSFDSSLRMWDITSDDQLHVLRIGTDRYPDSIAVSPDGRLLAVVACDNGPPLYKRDIQIWDIG